MSRSTRVALAALIVVLAALPVDAARPLLDSGKWDTYFALFARNTSVPWKRLSVRLDTYSGAPVDFAAYDVDPVDVLVAGANARPHAIDTSHMRPIARWRFTPPPGLTFESNDVDVPLQNREGFFVIEARRGDAVQQVWLNLTRVGLLTKESPGGSIVYGSDLGTGRAFNGMRVTYLVGTSFAYDKTDLHGISRVPAGARFALAEWGKSKTFVSFLPQSPPPAAVVAVRADRGAVRAGDAVRVIGFARRRAGAVYRPASGLVDVSLVARGKPLASAKLQLDRAGAFTTDLVVPAEAPAGDVAILATAAGASGGATVHVDAVGDTALVVQATCTTACPNDAPIPVTVSAKRVGVAAGNIPVRLRVVRTPHVLAPDEPSDAPAWGTTLVVDTTVHTDALGLAHLTIPAPSDGLASTYGVTASSSGATASTSLVAPNAKIALAVQPVASDLDVGDPATVDVRGFDALDGTPAAGTTVHVTVTHGPTQQAQDVTLDARGRGRVTFRDVALGMNLVSAEANVAGKLALDVASVTIAPRAPGAESVTGGSDIRLAFDKPRYKPNERVQVSASLGGAVGDAIVTLESARGVTTTVVPTQNGAVSASFAVPEALGATAIGVAFVRDGAIVDTTAPLAIDGPGHERLLRLVADRATYGVGSVAKIAFADGGDTAGATIAVRVTDRRAASGASFDDVAALLATSGTSTQNLASTDPPWHAWVAPARSKAGDLFGFDRPRQPPVVDTPTAAAARVLSWSVARTDTPSFSVDVPKEPGRYVLAVVKITDDGDVGAATLALTVQ